MNQWGLDHYFQAIKQNLSEKVKLKIEKVKYFICSK